MHGVLIFGDSITFGRGNTSKRGWCGRLREYFESQDNYNAFYNLGICGDTSIDLLERFDAEAKSRIVFRRDGDRFIVVFAIGMNDTKIMLDSGKPKVEIEEYENNIQKLINKAKKYTNEIYFIGITPVDEVLTKDYEGTSFTNDRIKEFNEVISKKCLENKLKYFDVFSEMIEMNYQKMLDDGLHPNSLGYEKMYDLIKEFMINEKIIS